MTYGVNAMGMGFPNYFSAQTYPSGAAKQWLNQQFMNNWGFATTPVYDLPMNVNMGYASGMTSPYAGSMNYGSGYGLGYGGAFMMPRYSKAYLDYINMDYKDRLAYDYDYNQTARAYDHLESRNAKQYAALADGETGNISFMCRSLQNALAQGDTDQVTREFERLVASLKGSHIYDKLRAEGAHTEEQIDLCIRNAAFEQYMAATGRDLATDISQKCDGAIANGFFSTLTFGHGQKYSKEEMISKLYGKKPPQSTEIKKAVGKLGGVVAYAGAGALTLGWIPVIGPLLGAGIGAGVGILASMA